MDYFRTKSPALPSVNEEENNGKFGTSSKRVVVLSYNRINQMY